jgi:hypothetical protein
VLSQVNLMIVDQGKLVRTTASACVEGTGPIDEMGTIDGTARIEGTGRLARCEAASM